MQAGQDWDTVSKSMEGVLEQEAKERALNRDAIATLRRRSMRTSTLSSATGGIAEAPGVSPKSAPRAAGKGLANGHTLAKRPERRVRRLRSLPGSSLRQGPPDALPLRRRQAGNRGGGEGADEAVDGSKTTGSVNTNGTHPTSSSSSRGAGAGASADSDRDTKKAEEDEAAPSWPSRGGGWAGGGGRRRRRGVPPGVTVTDTTPTRLSCGYCRKMFRAEVLDRHEDRCPSKNLDLFATPCVACGLQGPRCACWALRNGLLKETRAVPDKPLFALFKTSRGGEDGVANLEEVPSNVGSSTKRAAGFLGGWTAGEGLRRPVPLMGEERTKSGNRGPGLDEDDGGSGGGGGGGAPAVVESAEERWIRERDDWLFGRSKPNDSHGGLPPSPPSLPRAPACGGAPEEGADAGVRERRETQQGGDGFLARESDEAFMLRERAQMRSHLEKVRDAAKVRRYTERWFRFSSDPPEKIRHRDVPWLPRLSALGGTGKVFAGTGGGAQGGQFERFETLGVNEGDSADMKKAAVRAASLRWHPDKFMSKYGPRIAPEDRSNIAKDVQATMERITKLRERLHRQPNAAAERPSTPDHA